jgi:hypothetical protein
VIKQGLKLGAGALVTYFISAVLNMTLLVEMSGKWYALQVILNLVFFGLMALLMFQSGGNAGEKACTVTATVERIRQGGREPDHKVLEGRFDKRVALIAFLTCALPLLIVAGVNLAVEPYYPPVLVDPNAPTVEEIAQQYIEMNDEERAAFDARIAGEQTPTNWVNVVARVANMPYISVFSPMGMNPHGLNLLFLLFAVVSALPAPIGYLCGPALRKRKLISIEKGKKRKMKKLKVHQKPRQPQPPKMEV